MVKCGNGEDKGGNGKDEGVGKDEDGEEEEIFDDPNDRSNL